MRMFACGCVHTSVHAHRYSEQSTIIHTDSKEVPEITSWEVETALRDMKNGRAKGSDDMNIATLKTGLRYHLEDTCSAIL